jgi:hypothetical protein
MLSSTFGVDNDVIAPLHLSYFSRSRKEVTNIFNSLSSLPVQVFGEIEATMSTTDYQNHKILAPQIK